MMYGKLDMILEMWGNKNILASPGTYFQKPQVILSAL